MNNDPGRAANGLYEADPISVFFTRPARALLDRAYARPGQWVGTRLVNPGPQVRQYAISKGIDLDGPDPVSAGKPSGGLNTRTRYARAFVRAIYRQHQWYSMSGTSPAGWRSTKRTARCAIPLTVEVGRRVPASPQFDPEHPSRGGFPAGRAVRIMVQPDKKAARRHMARLPLSAKAQDERGNRGDRFPDPAMRDW